MNPASVTRPRRPPLCSRGGAAALTLDPRNANRAGSSATSRATQTKSGVRKSPPAKPTMSGLRTAPTLNPALSRLSIAALRSP